ncbi:MAG: hypothetical protein Q9190_004248 [Brigantiaea leucoxantha]
MSRRLKNIERMHPALASSACPSKSSSTLGIDAIRSDPTHPDNEIDFEKDLETSPVYKRAGFSRLRISNASTKISLDHSFLSGLSLSDVSNVSAVALPISSTELWNHHRYVTAQSVETTNSTQALNAWYNPPSTYAQAKFKGHLIYRRFSVTTPHSSPIFTEGALLPRIEEKPPGEGRNEVDELAELEDTSRRAMGYDLTTSNAEDIANLASRTSTDIFRDLIMMDDAARWRRSTLGRLDTLQY